MTTQPQPAAVQPIATLEQDVATWLDLTERIEQLTSQRDTVKARLAQHGVGVHTTAAGVKVTVSPPPRAFNLDRAWQMLTPEQRQLCLSPDAAKVKKQLPPVLAEDCMDPGRGANRVIVK